MFYLKSFAAGFLSTLFFHQGLIGLLFLLGIVPFAPLNMAPTQPLGVPSVISLAFFGGLWGVLIWKFIAHKKNRLWLSVILGSVGPTAVAMLLVFPLKGIPVQLAVVMMGLIINAFWGLGLFLINNYFYRL